jgi:hypothetical protein
MPSVDQLRSAPDPADDAARSTWSSAAGGRLSPEHTQPSPAVSRVLVGEAMIERAKSVIVVARRVDEDEAGQILLDAARRADIPVRLAADQVMTALLRSPVEEGAVQDTLVRALETVCPVDQPEIDKPSLATQPAGRVA